jgi:arylsulfatase A-like enzyme
MKAGVSLGATDDYCYNVTENPVHVHDVQATILHCLGIQHTKLTWKFQGRNFRLTDVHGQVVKPVLAAG